MKKQLIPILFLTVASTLSFAQPLKMINVSVLQSIKNTLGPNVNINYKSFNLDQNLDLKNKTGHINMTLAPAKALVKPALFDSILKGKSSLDVANHPQITFKSTKIIFTDDNKISSVNGTLTVKGKSVPVNFKKNSFTCTGELGSRKCKATFIAQLDRTKVGLNYGVSLGLSKQAPITLNLSAQE